MTRARARHRTNKAATQKTSWTHLGHILDTSWTHLGHILDTSWTHLGHILDTRERVGILLVRNLNHVSKQRIVRPQQTFTCQQAIWPALFLTPRAFLLVAWFLNVNWRCSPTKTPLVAYGLVHHAFHTLSWFLSLRPPCCLLGFRICNCFPLVHPCLFILACSSSLVHPRLFILACSSSLSACSSSLSACSPLLSACSPLLLHPAFVQIFIHLPPLLHVLGNATRFRRQSCPATRHDIVPSLFFTD